MTAPCLHLTIRERSGGVRSVEIPRTHQDQAKFAAGTPVIIALEDDPGDPRPGDGVGQRTAVRSH